MLVESAAKVHSDVKEANPAIPWAVLWGLHCRLRQTLDEIDAIVAWSSLREDFPKILDALGSITYPGNSTAVTA